ncbi:hypothetical protein MBM_04627 [Drepanopeziza brunnea f. sp. 'multigermtubi' MB_m1]|uniref:Uncharacterized protein n=1 Tax=Marssonina brunnea f. sp. multigermtubi (strain MB_m1) TaxID=1072389 RepID=K1WHI5_MARBU|nr:uncharacterized protein MBM_04627 [Drepanopeziza brunnea f. sp. 'multigermtubi' MB_m1]EKD17050.1 hypothetical protein MBM_04627 [Drepanopeziza brunnea f. sp. 'multigermtubi' MB_m1]
MGALLSCFSSSNSKSFKQATEAPLATANPQPTLSSSQQQQQPAALREGLADEHLASVPPPTTTRAQTQTQNETQARAEGVDSESNAVRNVAAGAPVPIADPEGEGAGKMATEDEYMSFLDKANRDPGEGVVEGKSEGGGNEVKGLKAVDEAVEVPQAIRRVLGKNESFYVSDADEPFVGVALKLGKGEEGLPDETTFAKLVQHPRPDEADVQIMDIGEWDPQGQYKDVVDATRESANGGDVRVYMIARDGPRVEYWVVGVEGGRLVGVKALAIES